MTGLFLRYCWRCNSAQTVVLNVKGACTECGEPTDSVDAHALIPALGHKLDRGQRQDAVEGLTKRK